MNILDPAIETYLRSLTPAREPVLAAMEAHAAENDFPIVGPLVGRFLQQIVLVTRARRVFEMGSGFGYSALWMALAMEPDGLIECTELSPANIARGQAYLADAKVAVRVTWHQGDALAVVQQATGPFDIILIDVDKHQYPEALELAWPRLRSGGVLITDNALWSGRMLYEDPPSDATRGVQAFNVNAYALPDGLATILPIRDGLLMAIKLRTPR